MSATAFLFDRSCLGPGGPFSVLIAQFSALIIESLCPPHASTFGWNATLSPHCSVLCTNHLTSAHDGLRAVSLLPQRICRKSKPNENDIFSLSAHPSMSADKVLAGFVFPLLTKEKTAPRWNEKRQGDRLRVCRTLACSRRCYVRARLHGPTRGP
jgi:hypothetical protein